jgi:hypothetical protein
MENRQRLFCGAPVFLLFEKGACKYPYSPFLLPQFNARVEASATTPAMFYLAGVCTNAVESAWPRVRGSSILQWAIYIAVAIPTLPLEIAVLTRVISWLGIAYLFIVAHGTVFALSWVILPLLVLGHQLVEYAASLSLIPRVAVILCTASLFVCAFVLLRRCWRAIVQFAGPPILNEEEKEEPAEKNTSRPEQMKICT